MLEPPFVVLPPVFEPALFEPAAPPVVLLVPPVFEPPLLLVLPPVDEPAPTPPPVPGSLLQAGKSTAKSPTIDAPPTLRAKPALPRPRRLAELWLAMCLEEEEPIVECQLGVTRDE